LNCGASLGGAFCAQCGQRDIDPDAGVGELAAEVAREVTNLDGKVPRTFRALLLRPGFLTREHFAGRRASYLPPFRLYLLCSLAFFLAWAFRDRSQVNDLRELSALAAGDSAKGTIVGRIGALRIRADSGATIDTTASTFSSRFTRAALRNPAAMQARLRENLPRMFFVLVPVFALLLKLSYRRAGANYPRHFYAALHLHAALFAVMALTTLLSTWPRLAGPGDALLLGGLAWYLPTTLRAVYGGSRLGTIGRSLTIAVVYLMIIGATFIGVMFLTVFTA
jgi:hypothetical protein